MKEIYKHWSAPLYLSDIVDHPFITVGKKSYYSGYYDNRKFEDGCVRFLWGDQLSSKLYNPMNDFGWTIDRLIIGNYVCIASGVVILMGGNHNHNQDFLTVYPFEETIKESYKSKGDTVIESDVWIGMNAMIMPGVKIEEGAIIAAGSIVTKDVPAYSIVGGNPAKVIRQRFSNEVQKMLEEMKWFDWDDVQIKGAVHILSSQDIDSLYEYYLNHVK
ncbi:CatB-related O-acetyltransferase [Erysipelothrix urinaevulpis]|uniref:CatB-related O-acetyltransferase n=1 Tax=Erysipelothrix urinaevulpis TaxID=2683717 RepID=UPI00135B921C|nr:CatB-related O-acetyltransferase [Erysipelothrix urinaevulpis]